MGGASANTTSLTNIGTNINTLQGDVGRVESSVADVHAAASSNAVNVDFKVVNVTAKGEVLSVTGSGYVYMIATTAYSSANSSVVIAKFDDNFVKMVFPSTSGNEGKPGIFAAGLMP